MDFNLKNSRLSALLWIVWNEDEEPYTTPCNKLNGGITETQKDN